VLGPFGDLAGVLIGLAFVLAGRPTEALPWVERAAGAAVALQAPASIAAADALSAEISGEPARLGAAPSAASSIGQALQLRARAVRGDARALEALRQSADALVMPGLLIGL